MWCGPSKIIVEEVDKPAEACSELLGGNGVHGDIHTIVPELLKLQSDVCLIVELATVPEYHYTPS